MNRKSLLGLVVLTVFFALVGLWQAEQDMPGENTAAPQTGEADGTAARAAESLRFVRWEHPQQLFSAQVPQGWYVEGQIDPQGLDKGAFMIRGFAPDGRAMFTFAHNWLWFMEYQYGPYRPGTATLESLVVPGLAQNLPRLNLSQIRVAYVSPNRSFQVTNPDTGMPLRGDQGSLGLLARNGAGEILAGSLLGETLYIPMPGTPGLWSLRIFSGGIAPNTPTDQAAIQAIQQRLADSLELSPEFRRIWGDAHQRTVESMRVYSQDMDRAFGGYLASLRRESASPGQSPEEKWAEMMRGGHYENDDRTGERHWVGNDYQYWWKNDQGHLTGNNTGQPPADHGNWYPIRR